VLATVNGAVPVATVEVMTPEAEMVVKAPVLAVVALLSFIGTFNEFILARLFLVDMDSRTIAVGLQQFIGGQYSENWGPFAAGSILASVPIVIIFLSLQKYIVSGLTAGSVKG
jgi:arabinogalactan oligomer/maltooligosaccharide transport system permease protein